VACGERWVRCQEVDGIGSVEDKCNVVRGGRDTRGRRGCEWRTNGAR
jgi:hypothetical protein